VGGTTTSSWANCWRRIISSKLWGGRRVRHGDGCEDWAGVAAEGAAVPLGLPWPVSTRLQEKSTLKARVLRLKLWLVTATTGPEPAVAAGAPACWAQDGVTTPTLEGA
jgi:hypothetical protein